MTLGTPSPVPALPTKAGLLPHRSLRFTQVPPWALDLQPHSLNQVWPAQILSSVGLGFQGAAQTRTPNHCCGAPYWQH